LFSFLVAVLQSCLFDGGAKGAPEKPENPVRLGLYQFAAANNFWPLF
jgi:hypothetical protein